MSTPYTLSEDALARARQVRLVAFDVDGVLTDGGLFYGDDGQEYKAFNSLDGHGLKMLHNNGFATAIITGRTSRVVEHRAANLGIDLIYQGQHNKLEALQQLKNATGLADAEIAYVGDDVVDLPVMCRIGLAIAVQNAHPLVVEHSHWQTPRNGGHGAARDACEMLLEAHGLLQQEWLKYLP